MIIDVCANATHKLTDAYTVTDVLADGGKQHEASIQGKGDIVGGNGLLPRCLNKQG